MMKIKSALKNFLLVLLLPFAVATPQLRAAEPIGEPFTYKKVEGREMKLYVTKPADWKPADHRPAIVFFHGGGWVGGTVAQFNKHSAYLATRGMVAVQVDYRLLDKTKKGPPLVCVQDAKSAMRWVRDHAKELGIDPARIAAAGGSAGGHLAAFVGMVNGKDDPQDDLKISPKANALVLFNPVFNNGPGNYAYNRIGERYKEFSPAHNIRKDAPPTVVFIGTRDDLIPIKTVKDFEGDMKKVGARCDVHIYEGQKHGFYGEWTEGGKYAYETLLETDKFLASLGWLKGPATLRRNEIGKD